MRRHRLAYSLVPCGLVLFASACKSSSSTSESFIEILETVPADNQTNVNLQTRIGFQIDGSIDPASLSSDTFFMTDGEGTIVSSTVMVTDQPDTAALIPEQPLSVITDYTVTVTTELLSTDGRGLEQPHDWEFRTLDSEWGTSEWLEQVGTGVSDQARIAVDGQSAAIAVWEYTEETGSGIWANRYVRSSLWGEPERISGGDEATTPQVALDDAGNGFAVWAQREGSDATIWTNRYAMDEGWGDPELLQDGEVTPARIPSIAADSEGSAIAIWSQRDLQVAVNERVWARRFEPGDGWGPAQSIDDETTTGLTQNHTAVGMDDDGNAIAVWARGNSFLWANRYSSSSGWGTAELIKANPDTDVGGERLAVGANGDAFVVWVETEGARGDIWSARFSGSRWGAPERIDSYDAGNKSKPDVAVDASGVAHAVWSQSDSDFDNIWASRYNPGSGWGTPALIEPPNLDPTEDANASDPRVATNDAGNTFVVWRQDSDQWGSIWSNRIDPGMEWSAETAELIEDIAQAARAPQVVVDENRHAHAVWLHALSFDVEWVRTNRFE